MNQEAENLAATLELVRAAAPTDYSGAESPDTEAAWRLISAELDVSPPSKTARPRRRTLAFGAIAAGTAVATVVVVNVASTGDGGVSRALDNSGVFVSQARAAQIVARIKHALTDFGPNQIVVSKAIQHQSGGGFSDTVTWSQRESTSPPYREWLATTLVANKGPGWNYEEGTTAQGIPQVYDPERNTIFEPSVKPAWRLTPGTRTGTWTLTMPAGQIRTLLRGKKLPPADRGLKTLTVTAAQARALRSGAQQVVYSIDTALSTQKLSIYIHPHLGLPPGNFTGNGPVERPSAWDGNLQARGVRVRLDGKAAIEISSRVNPTTDWFSAKTLYPIKEVTKSGNTTVTTRYTVYEVLSGAAATPSLLSLQHVHPTAKIVVGMRSYLLAADRLGAEGY